MSHKKLFDALFNGARRPRYEAYVCLKSNYRQLLAELYKWFGYTGDLGPDGFCGVPVSKGYLECYYKTGCPFPFIIEQAPEKLEFNISLMNDLAIDYEILNAEDMQLRYCLVGRGEAYPMRLETGSVKWLKKKVKGKNMDVWVWL